MLSAHNLDKMHLIVSEVYWILWKNQIVNAITVYVCKDNKRYRLSRLNRYVYARRPLELFSNEL